MKLNKLENWIAERSDTLRNQPAPDFPKAADMVRQLREQANWTGVTPISQLCRTVELLGQSLVKAALADALRIVRTQAGKVTVEDTPETERDHPLTIRELATLAGVRVQTVYNAIYDRKITAVRATTGNRWLISATECERYIDARSRRLTIAPAAPLTVTKA